MRGLCVAFFHALLAVSAGRLGSTVAVVPCSMTSLPSDFKFHCFCIGTFVLWFVRRTAEKNVNSSCAFEKHLHLLYCEVLRT